MSTVNRIADTLPEHERALAELILRLREAREAALGVLEHHGAYGEGNPDEAPGWVREDCHALLWQLDAFEASARRPASAAARRAADAAGPAPDRQLQFAGAPEPDAILEEGAAPPHEGYARQMAEALAVLGRGLKMVNGLLAVPEEDLDRMWTPEGTVGGKNDLAWLLDDLRGLRYNLAQGLSNLGGDTPWDVQDLRDRLAVEVVEREEADPAHEVDALAAG